MDQRRTLRVSEAVREELTELIGFETEDPRLLSIEVLDAHVSPDGRHATVRVAPRGTDREQKESMDALEHARHYLRQELARRLNLRKMPELHFELDPLRDTAERIAVLLRRAKKTRAKSENQP